MSRKRTDADDYWGGGTVGIVGVSLSGKHGCHAGKSDKNGQSEAHEDLQVLNVGNTKNVRLSWKDAPIL